MTQNKRRILDALRAVGDDEALESGQAPFPAIDVARKTGKPLRDVARTLRNMERQGLVIAEIRKVDVWADLKRPGHVKRQLKCYWRADTMEEDKARAQQWHDEASIRQERAMRAFDRLFMS